MKIVISAETVTWTERDPDPRDPWDNGDTAGRVSDVRGWIARDWENDPRWDWGCSWSGDLDVAPGGYVYAVVADYESGSTFGRDGGYSDVVDVFTDIVTADALRDVAEHSGDYGFTFNGKEYYAPWRGYFEYLQAMKVWPVKVDVR